LATRGAAICINYASRVAEAEAAAAEIAAAGGRAIAIQADVADADAVARMVARTEAELGPVSILVNNAGVSSPATLESYDPAAMARMRRVNVDGVIHTIGAVAPGMQERGYGRIVNIASNAAIGTALSGTTFYAATEAEVLVKYAILRTHWHLGGGLANIGRLQSRRGLSERPIPNPHRKTSDRSRRLR
jgi:3-oxoacyl-[acyl-carrier protein] reductase